MPSPSRASTTPDSTSPLPPLAMPQLPVVFIRHRPSGPATTVPGPFSTTTAPDRRAKSSAAAVRPWDRSPPTRRNSPSWGVSTVTRPRRRSHSSICPASAFMPSASSTSGWGRSISRRTSASVCQPRPRPQPSSTASQPAARRRIVSSASRDSRPSASGRGKGMASSLFTAATGQILSGTPRNTSPAPERTAPRLANTGAPV